MNEATPSYVQITGHGTCLRPRAPFALQKRRDDTLEVLVEVDGREQTYQVDPSSVWSPRLEAFGALEPGPKAAAWQIEVGGVYTLPWPPQFAVVSAPEPSEPPFFLLRLAPGALVYVQGPFAPGDAPRTAELIGAGQREVDRGRHGDTRWIELAYDHAGEGWRQRHLLTPFAAGATIAVSTQAREPLATRVHDLAAEVAASLRPYRRSPDDGGSAGRERSNAARNRRSPT